MGMGVPDLGVRPTQVRACAIEHLCITCIWNTLEWMFKSTSLISTPLAKWRACKVVHYNLLCKIRHYVDDNS